MCPSRRFAVAALSLANLLGCSAAPAAATAPRPTSDASATESGPGAEARGVVVDAEGNAVEGALVALIPPFTIEGESPPPFTTVAGAGGRFAFSDVPAGRYGLTATAPRRAGAYGGAVTFPLAPGRDDLRLTLGSTGFTTEGAITDARGAPVGGALIQAARISENEGDVFVAKADDAGRYALTLAPGTPYIVVVDAPGLPRTPRRIDPKDAHIDFTLDPPAAPRPEKQVIRAWLEQGAIPWKGVDPSLPLDDLEPLRGVIGDAQLVGLGEATHGASEMFQAKHRLVTFLVEKMGFRVFAIEAGWSDTLAVNDYVLRGKGDAESAVRGLITWAWETEEVLALVRWLREYNQDPRHRNSPVSFQGFDVVAPRAAEAVLAYLKRVDPGALPDAEARFAPFRTLEVTEAWTRPETLAALAELVARFDERRDAYVKTSGAHDWKVARHHAQIVKNAAEQSADPTVRDAHMAEHVAWLLDDSPPGTKVVLWAHNAHISTHPFDISDLGVRLRARYGGAYCPIGFAFDHGSFRAMDWRSEPRRFEPEAFTLGSSPADSLAAAFDTAGAPVFLVDLRTAPADVRPWLEGPVPSWQLGGAFRGEAASLVRYPPRRSFDAMVYVRAITAAHPLPKRRPEKP